jgi:hypothetical protein
MAKDMILGPPKPKKCHGSCTEKGCDYGYRLEHLFRGHPSYHDVVRAYMSLRDKIQSLAESDPPLDW